MAAPEQPKQRKAPGYMKFILGGTAGMMATCVVQPMDVIKTRFQISGAGTGKAEYANTFECFKDILKNDGPFGLYLGIGAGLLRQATYSTTRLGVYTWLNDFYKTYMETDPSVLASMGMGTAAGGIGAFVGTPAEVALIRMQSDGKLPPAERRNYSNVLNALVRIFREEGLTALWRGCIPTIGRACVVNMSQLASYSQLKGYLKRNFQMKDGLKTHFLSAMASGFITSIVSMPLDIAKTRIQNMKGNEYKGTIDALAKIGAHEGIFAFWKGFTPYFLRIGPHTVLMFMFLEQLNKLYAKHFLGGGRSSSGL